MYGKSSGGQDSWNSPSYTPEEKSLDPEEELMKQHCENYRFVLFVFLLYHVICHVLEDQGKHFWVYLDLLTLLSWISIEFPGSGVKNR